jgi:hypothetical protein
MAIGVHRGDAIAFEEVGHGDVLTRIYQTIKRQTPDAALDVYLNELRRDSPADNLTGQGNFTEAARRSTVPAQKVSAWNRGCPIGTRVRSSLMENEQLETRTHAMVLFGHRAAVYMKGYNGYFDLDEIVPLQGR